MFLASLLDFHLVKSICICWNMFTGSQEINFHFMRDVKDV